MKESFQTPISFLNPTARRRAIILPPPQVEPATVNDEELLPRRPPPRNARTEFDGAQRIKDADHYWRARDNRKGRHTIAVTPTAEGRYLAPPLTNTLRPILHNLWRMITYYPVWDVSYITAQWFTWGSVVWVINSFFVWLPFVRPSSEFHGEVANAGGISAFVGATIFVIGSVFLMVEAVNENRTECFGWAFEETLDGNGLVRLHPSNSHCTHHHPNKQNLVGKGVVSRVDAIQSGIMPPKKFPEARELETWTWFPTVHELRSHYFHEIGFLACLAQFIASIVYWISGFTALPSIQAALSKQAINGAYWAPQIIGGVGFIISSLLFSLETQTRWWRPAPSVLGWWIGAWNLIGAIGFTMSGAFGYWTGSKGQYESGLTTFWGSWAFLIGSCVQWYESLVKHPVETNKSAGTDHMPLEDTVSSEQRV